MAYKPQMWCSHCQNWTVCPTLSREFYDTQQSSDGDFHWFERQRKCQKCNTNFKTIELHADFLSQFQDLGVEVKNLRERLGKVKRAVAGVKK